MDGDVHALSLLVAGSQYRRLITDCDVYIVYYMNIIPPPPPSFVENIGQCQKQGIQNCVAMFQWFGRVWFSALYGAA